MRVLSLLLILVPLARVSAQNGNGVTTSCAQQALCDYGCVNTQANGICYQCGPGWWKNTIGSAICQKCPANSMSPNVSDSIISCTCNLGYTGQNGAGPCTACIAGKYKITTGDALCPSCAVGKYSTAVGARAAATCLACPNDSNTLLAASGTPSLCKCNYGYTGPSGGTCTACGVGKYKDQSGATACDFCANGKYNSDTGMTTSASCISCPAESFSYGTGVCTCNLGYTGDPGTCTACARGKYKTTSGSQACTDCAAGKYNQYEGSHTSTHCRPCSTTSQGLAAVGSTTAENCICNIGYYYDTTYEACESCTGGTYKDTIGNAQCTNCPPSSYSETFSTCLPCPSDSTCFFPCYDAGACICNAGYYGDPSIGDTCTVCPPNSGSYCTVGSCTAIVNCFCNQGYYGSAGSCTACPANSGSNCADHGSLRCAESQEQCLCNAGYAGPNGGPCIDTTTPCEPGYTRLDGGPCSPCAAGTYKNTTGSAACTDCPAGTYKDTTGSAPCVACPTSYTSVSVGSRQCIACPQDSNSLDGISCLCNAGYTRYSDALCDACVVGTYKNSTGSLACTTCPTATYSDTDAAATCMACPLYSGSSCSGCYTSNCPCNAGYTRGNFTGPYSISDCSRLVALIPSKPSLSSVANRAKAGLGTLPTYNAVGGPNGKGHVSFDRTLSNCVNTGPRTFNVATNGGFTIVMVMRFTGTALANEAIMHMFSGNVFARYNEMYVTRYNSNGQLIFLISNSDANAWSWYLNYVLEQNTWATVVITYSASTSKFSFTINGIGSTGVAVPIWNDKMLSGINMGTHPFYTSENFNGDIAGAFVVDEYLSQTATTEIANAMKQGVDLTNTTCPTGNACTACASATYKNSSGMASCTTCPENSGASCVGCTAFTDCTCNAGYTGPSGGPCSPCAAGTYKNAPGSAACTACPYNTVSLASGSNSSMLCVCVTGYESSNATVSNRRLLQHKSTEHEPRHDEIHELYKCNGDQIRMFVPDPAPHYVCRTAPPFRLPSMSYKYPLARRILNSERRLLSERCIACNSLSYKISTGNTHCQQCPSDTFSQDGVTCVTIPTTTSVATTTPTSEPESYVVKMVVALPLTIQEFNNSAQIKFKQSVARASGVSSTDVTIERIVDMNGGTVRRRLLSTGIRVETSVKAPNESAASAISTSLTADTLNSALVEAGLPAATILEAPTFASERAMTTPAPNAPPFASDRQMTTTPVSAPVVIAVAKSEPGLDLVAVIGGIVGGLSLFILVLCGCMYHKFGRRTGVVL